MTKNRPPKKSKSEKITGKIAWKITTEEERKSRTLKKEKDQIKNIFLASRVTICALFSCFKPHTVLFTGVNCVYFLLQVVFEGMF